MVNDYSFDFAVIDGQLNNIGLFIEAVSNLFAILFNNLIFLFMFCFFIALLWTFIKIFDLRSYIKKGDY